MQKVDLYQPISASRVGPPPLTLRVGVTPNADYVAGGVPTVYSKQEVYILLSALPAELRERVTTAVQSIIAGM